MTDLTRAVDTDFNGGGAPREQAWFDHLVTLGYEGFITTSHTYWGQRPRRNTNANESFRRALAAGLWIGCYSRPVHLWEEGVLALDSDIRAQLKFFVLDVEPEPGGPFPVLREYVDGVASYGLRPVIYTGRGMWHDVMGSGAGGFSDVPLHDFAGDIQGWPESIDEAPIFQYGGWNTPTTMRVGWQVRMQNPPSILGQGVDDNVFTKEFIYGEEPEPVDPVEEGLVGSKVAAGYLPSLTVPMPEGTEEGDAVLLHVSANDKDLIVNNLSGWTLLNEVVIPAGTRVSVYHFTGDQVPASVNLDFNGAHWHSAVLTSWRGYEVGASDGVGGTTNTLTSLGTPVQEVPAGHEGFQVVSGYNWSNTEKDWTAPVQELEDVTRGLSVGYVEIANTTEDPVNTPTHTVSTSVGGRMATTSTLLLRQVHTCAELPDRARFELPGGTVVVGDLEVVDGVAVMTNLEFETE